MSQNNFALYHYQFDAKVKLFDIRRNALKNPGIYSKPVAISDKFHFEIYEVSDDDNPSYTPTSNILSEVENYKLIKKMTFRSSFKNITQLTTKYQTKLNTVNTWFPDENPKESIFSEYEKILGYTPEILSDNVAGYSTFQNNIHMDERYRNLIRENKEGIYNELELNYNIYDMLASHGSVNILEYLSHDLTYIHPLFKNSDYLKKLYKQNVKFNTFYISDIGDLIIVKISNIGDDEPMWNMICEDIKMFK